MKSFLKYKFVVPVLLAMLALGSCTKEPLTGTGKDGEFVEVSIKLGVKPDVPLSRSGDAENLQPLPQKITGDGISVTYSRGQGATRAGGTAVTELQETTVNNLWVLQFDDANNKLASQYVPAPERVEQGGDVYYEFSALLEETAGATTIFFVANAGAEAGLDAVTDLTGFKALTHSFPDQNSVSGETEEMTGMAMSGRWYSATGITASSTIIADVERLASKLTIHIRNNILTPNFNMLEITSLQIQSVANIGSYYNFASYDGDNTWLFPSVDNSDDNGGDNFFNYDRVPVALQEDFDEGGIYRHQDFTWYVTENRQGVNDAIPEQINKWRENDPSFISSGVSRATRVVLKGIYTHSSGDDVGVPRGVTITIYPGDNIIDDFNVARNCDYQMNITLNTLRDEDQRVEFDPLITFNYYVVDPDNFGADPMLMIADRVFGPEEGAPFIGNAEFPALDYTTAAVLNKHKDILDQWGYDQADYQDGVVLGNKPTTVSATDENNVVNIYYYENGITPPSGHTITFRVCLAIREVYQSTHATFTVDNIPDGSSFFGMFSNTPVITLADGMSTEIKVTEDDPYKANMPAGYAYRGSELGYTMVYPGGIMMVDESNITQDIVISLWFERLE